MRTDATVAEPRVEPLPIALRAWTELPPEPSEARRGKRVRGRSRPADRHVLVLDTETTTDRSQRLNFGVYRYYRTRRPGAQLACVEEGIFHDDALPHSNPDGYRALWDYAKYREPAVDWKAGDELTADAPVQIRLLTASEMRTLIYEAAYKLGALVVCFNLPFDLSRLATSWTDTRGGRTRRRREGSSFAGGFTLRYFEHNGKPNRFRPELQIKTIDSKRALKRWNVPHKLDDQDRDADGKPFRGHLLDLRTAAFALTNKGHTLESACEAFGVPYTKREVEHGEITPEYVDYCREDVAATAKLHEAIAAEYRRHPIDLQITKAYSPASIGKAYLRALGIKPRLELQPDFPRDVLGWAMCAYHGGRAECRIRRVQVPVVYLDFLSMYPTVNALMGLWQFVTARRIDVKEATDEARALLEQIGLEDCLNPATWKQLPALMQIRPCGDVLPVRARYGTERSWGIGSNPLHAEEPLWYPLPEVIASKLITRRAPEIVRALKLVPVGQHHRLKPVKLRGRVEIDPRTADLFKTTIEERNRLRDKEAPLGRFLKTLANATSYGIYAEMNRKEGRRTKDIDVYGIGPEPLRPGSEIVPEEPGPFAFPPLAACITAAARLMLATLEVLVTEAGGAWAFADTDSMAVVATSTGETLDYTDHTGTPRTIPALTWAQVDETVERFRALNPYDREIVPGSILEIEKENYGADGERRQLYCHAISAKRYALYNLDQAGQPVLRRTVDEQDSEDDETPGPLGELRKHSEHGLGHLLNPIDPEDESRDWIAQSWERIIRTDALGQPASDPDWIEHPALTRATITTAGLLKPFDKYNSKRPVAERIRPYNFMLVAHVARLGHPPGTDPERFLLVAPYETDPCKWRKLAWTNAYEPGSRYRIITEQEAKRRSADDSPVIFPGEVIVKTYRDVLAEYQTHPETKSLGPDGQPGDRATIGLLARRPVKVAAIHYIGKESNKIEEATSGLVTDLDDVLTEYPDPKRDPFDQLVRPLIRTLPVKQLAAGAGISERTVKRTRAGDPISKTARTKLTGHAVRHAYAQLRAAGIRPPADREALLATSLEQRQAREQGAA